MYFKIPDQGELEMLKLLTANTSTWCVKLYKNDRIPQDADTAANYTEADFDGYNGTMVLSNWSNPAHQFGVAQSTADNVAFSCTGNTTPNTIYGYYVVDSSSGKLLWAEYFDMPQDIGNSGDTITLTPKLTLSTTDDMMV